MPQHDEVEILLVEDNADDVELCLHALRKEKLSNKIHVARDGQEALEYLFDLAKQTPEGLPRLVLLDLKLPKIDGLEVLRRLRADERTKRLPVVVFTSSSEEEDKIRSYSLGANSYVRKPVQFEHFIEATKQLGMYWLVLNEVPQTE